MDVDDELCLALAAAAHRRGECELLGVVANLAPSDLRARLAKGSLGCHGLSGVPAGVGSDCGQRRSALPHEFDAGYLAEPAHVQADGEALLVRALEAAPPASVTLLCISGLTDASLLLARHGGLCRDRLARVVIQADARLPEPHQEARVLALGRGWRRLSANGSIGTWEPDDSNNCTFDPVAARVLYAQLAVSRIPTLLVSRHAANAASVTPAFYDRLADMEHPVARRLGAHARAALQHFWESCHLPAGDPGRAQMPDRCDRDYFLNTFCGGAQTDRGPADEI